MYWSSSAGLYNIFRQPRKVLDLRPPHITPSLFGDPVESCRHGLRQYPSSRMLLVRRCFRRRSRCSDVEGVVEIVVHIKFYDRKINPKAPLHYVAGKKQGWYIHAVGTALWTCGSRRSAEVSSMPCSNSQRLSFLPLSHRAFHALAVSIDESRTEPHLLQLRAQGLFKG